MGYLKNLGNFEKWLGDLKNLGILKISWEISKNQLGNVEKCLGNLQFPRRLLMKESPDGVDFFENVLKASLFHFLYFEGFQDYGGGAPGGRKVCSTSELPPVA